MIKDVKEELKEFEEKMAKMSPEEQREYGRSFGKSGWKSSPTMGLTMATLDLLDDENKRSMENLLKTLKNSY